MKLEAVPKVASRVIAHFLKLRPKDFLQCAVEYGVASLPALAFNDSSPPDDGISLWVELVDPGVSALLAGALGADTRVTEVGVGQIPKLLGSRSAPSVVLCDVRRHDIRATLEAVRSMNPPVPVVALCPDDTETVSETLKAGAYDCIVMPASEQLLASSIRRAAAHHQLMTEYHDLEQRVDETREPTRNLKPHAGKPLPNGRWLQNVLPLDPSTKTSETSSLSLGVGDSDTDHDVVEQSLSPEQHLRQGHRLGEAKADFERRYLQAALAKCRGNLAAAARCSGMDRSNFRRLLKRYGLHPGSVQRS